MGTTIQQHYRGYDIVLIDGEFYVVDPADPDSHRELVKNIMDGQDFIDAMPARPSVMMFAKTRTFDYPQFGAGAFYWLSWNFHFNSQHYLTIEECLDSLIIHRVTNPGDQIWAYDKEGKDIPDEYIEQYVREKLYPR